MKYLTNTTIFCYMTIHNDRKTIFIPIEISLQENTKITKRILRQRPPYISPAGLNRYDDRFVHDMHRYANSFFKNQVWFITMDCDHKECIFKYLDKAYNFFNNEKENVLNDTIHLKYTNHNLLNYIK